MERTKREGNVTKRNPDGTNVALKVTNREDDILKANKEALVSGENTLTEILST
ncbi:hypothetical protein BOH78_0626 [Pichia kudriavzevii]|uniref:Uncharacterized protein n=1 Tax=Pichia kudriavzevii TaxID=4909 RepID=A0A099NR72_PICKU|nr:hypothetical protein JL09_g6441 [Pichia kudriavzevii]ONH77245.1 hypothetical protein BOH78_0626 [Pichia kudriavzevii]